MHTASAQAMEALAAELLAQPRRCANNLPKLLAGLTGGGGGVSARGRGGACAHTPPPLAPPHPPAPKRLQAPPELLCSLTLFFLDSFERGELEAAPPQSAAGTGASSPDAVHAAWLRRQYAAFVSALVALVGGASPQAREQVRGVLPHLTCCCCRRL